MAEQFTRNEKVGGSSPLSGTGPAAPRRTPDAGRALSELKGAPALVPLVVYDFDGVMTDNRVLVSEDGRESVWAHRGDGWGVRLLQERGVRQLILSAETNPVVSARAAKLGIEAVQRCEDKRAAVLERCAELRCDPADVVYVGNDTNDLPAMRLVGWPVAPRDAHPAVRAVARHVTRSAGGRGVVREVADWLLSALDGDPAQR